MPYVMVPVPEDYVEEVMQFILKAVARAASDPWDQEGIEHLFSAVDEPSRSLLSVIARGTIADRDVSEVEAADMLEFSRRETIGIMREINEQARELSRPPLITPRMVTELLPNGRTQEKRVLAMEADVAEFVQRAERVELEREPDPLGGQAG